VSGVKNLAEMFTTRHVYTLSIKGHGMAKDGSMVDIRRKPGDLFSDGGVLGVESGGLRKRIHLDERLVRQGRIVKSGSG
jgi:hypothetical protein